MTRVSSVKSGCYLKMEPMGSTQIMDGHTGRAFPTCQGLSCRRLLHWVRYPTVPTPVGPRPLCHLGDPMTEPPELACAVYHYSLRTGQDKGSQ